MEDKCFLFGSRPVSWDEAVTTCSGYGSDVSLAEITSDTDEKFLNEKWQFSGRSYWMGITDSEKEGVWKNVDGKDVEFSSKEI